ncbi:response regulator receiver domain protein [Mageeibacillus indolicus UPII9-5]|uniref:Stage 0 sporulation protein A homolog n=1 Tax=Mageeibacillus indolicus (strain UPII9-5) TaxID=699246 RepID=D3QZR3_MAGIU|nr:response regulator transcription factor [Mageeibacillus indolicus]ADC91815.1 response regulator receiver domain protein [Mageeibacillus indolicus UPII9-5]
MKLLVVEDEQDLRESIAEGLRLSGYAVDTAADGAAGEDMLAAGNYDLVVLDINLPYLDGFTLLERLRAVNKEIRVIILTARTDIDDLVRGLDTGANDYLVKPFHFVELEARIRSLLRRRQVQEDLLITCQGFSFNLKTKAVSCAGGELRLTSKELSILEYLLLNRGRHVSQEELLEHVWEDGMNEFSNTVRVHVSALRKKLKAATGRVVITNEIGRGYIIEADGTE